MTIHDANPNHIATPFLFAPGLDQVIVAETTLSHVDGEKGELILRGHTIDQLAGHKTTEEAARLLWTGLQQENLDDLCAQFGKARQEAFPIAHLLAPLAQSLSTIEWMRTGLDCLAEENAGSPVAITGALAVFLAASFRLKQGQAPLAPNPGLDLAEDLLTMLHGRQPPKAHKQALDRYLVTILDHGLNASTFTARVIASTQSDLRSAISGAIGALKGPLHGGAPGPVLDMLEEIGSPAKADRWIQQELAAGRRLMGFGHRIYRVRDPRADILKGGLAPLRQTSGKIEHAEQIEAAALKALHTHKPDRVLDTNVEFYTAVLLDAIGIDRTLFTPLFAVGRSIGWSAHCLEQWATGKLIRPQSRYVGPTTD